MGPANWMPRHHQRTFVCRGSKFLSEEPLHFTRSLAVATRRPSPPLFQPTQSAAHAQVYSLGLVGGRIRTATFTQTFSAPQRCRVWWVSR